MLSDIVIIWCQLVCGANHQRVFVCLKGSPRRRGKAPARLGFAGATIMEDTKGARQLEVDEYGIPRTASNDISCECRWLLPPASRVCVQRPWCGHCKMSIFMPARQATLPVQAWHLVGGVQWTHFRTNVGGMSWARGRRVFYGHMV